MVAGCCGAEVARGGEVSTSCHQLSVEVSLIPATQSRGDKLDLSANLR